MEGNDRSQGSLMEKTFRGRVRSSVAVNSDQSSGKMATGNPDDSLHWPSIAGPSVPENNPKLWKAPKLDMASSLAVLRRELAAMQLQDRGIHKQLLALNSAIRDLKTNLNDSWDSEDTSSVTQTAEEESEEEVLSTATSESLATQVSHTKQDSGILTDEESGDECDVFDNREYFRPTTRTSRSVSAICLPSGFTPELDINQNVITTIKGYNLSTTRSRSHTVSDGNNLNTTRPRSHTVSEGNINTTRSRSHTVSEGNNLNTTRPRSHTVSEAQFHRVTSMPVINEIPDDFSRNSPFKGKAFAISGFINKPRPDTRPQSHLGFEPISRHESMPTISNIGRSSVRSSVRHVRSETIPFARGINNSFNSYSDISPSRTNKKPIYRIWRSSSQVSLV